MQNADLSVILHREEEWLAGNLEDLNNALPQPNMESRERLEMVCF